MRYRIKIYEYKIVLEMYVPSAPEFKNLNEIYNLDFSFVNDIPLNCPKQFSHGEINRKR